MAEQNPSVPSDSDVQRILSTIKQVESSGDYGAKAKGSSASGAYQFIDDTWQRSTKRYGIGTEYKTAADAPPEVQDAVAARAVRDILGQVGGDVTKVPMVWYTGNPQGRMTEAAIKANQGQTADMYQQKWLAVFNQGRPTQAASTKVAQAPTTTLGTRITAQVPGAKQAGVQVAAAFNPSDLPSSYTSALALNYLADTDPEGVTMGKVNEMLADMMEEGGGASRPTGGKILQQFAQAKSVDPFQFVLQPEEPKQVQQRVIPKMPKMMADGGLATKALAANRPTLTKTDYDWLQARQKEFQNYNTQVDEYQKAIDAYNAKVDAYNAAQGEGVTHPGEFTTAAPTAPSTTEEQLQAYQTAAQNRAKRYYVARATGLESLVNPQKYNLSGMSFSFEKGGEVQSPGVSEEDKLRSFLDKTVGGLNYDIDPLEARLVRKQRGYEGRVSLPIAGVTPYADINPGGGVRPTEVGVTYGNMGPQGGFQVGYSQPMGGPQQIPPRITGQYRQQLDRNSAIEAGGYYMPLPGAPDVYGANVRYTRRFEKGGDVNANPADVAEQMTVGTLPEDQGTSILDKYLAFRQRNIVRRPGIFGPLGPIVGNYIFEKGYLPPTVHEFLGYAPPGDVWDPEGLKKMYGQEQVVKRQFGSPEEGEVAAQQMTVGTLPEGQRPAGQVFRDIGRDVVRGMQYLPYDLLGGPVDIATMAMRPFGYNVEKPIGGSEWLIEKSRQAGIADQPTGSLAETATRIGMGFVNPAAVARQIPKGIAALEKGVEKMTLPAFRQITGNPNATKEEMMDFVLNQKNIMQAGTSAIVKPKGGTFVSGEHSTFDNALEDITSSINREKQNWGYAADAGDVVKKLETISDFFNTRFKNYYQKRLGSQDDPLRDAFVRGDFNGGDWFNVQELNDIRARIANPQTSSVQKEELLRLLNSKYDAWTDINAIVPERNSIGKKLAYPSSESVNIIQKKLKEQGVNVDKKDISVTAETRDNYLIGDKGLNAINQGDVAYDVGSSPTLGERADLIKDYLMTLNPNQIKNITFEDAIIGAERYHEALKNPAIKFTPQELFEGREKMFNVGDKYQWSEIKTVEALKREGLAMDHCIQGDDYCRQLTSGVGRHFSLQDAKTGIPHTTISTYRSPFAGPESKHVVIGQIKGHSNSIASKYFDQIEKFLEEYEKQVGKIYITEKPKFIPPAFKKAEYTQLPRGYEGNQYAKGGMVDKPLYDRAV